MRVLILSIGLATALHGQYMLTSGVPNAFYYTGSGLQNGKNGFAIPITGDPLVLTVTMQVTPASSAMNIYVRCGSDVAGGGNGFLADTSAQTAGNLPVTLTVSRPNGGTAGNCYIASQIIQNTANVGGVGGKIIATISPFPTGGTQLTIPSLASLFLAGQPGGTRFGSLSAPSNSPPQAQLQITPGQGLSVLASGAVSNYGPDGPLELFQARAASTNGGLGQGTGQFGLSDAIVPANSLIGVFVGNTVDSTHTPYSLEYYPGDLLNTQTLSPALQQVFYIGGGVTPQGQTRVFVVPPGATALYLASTAGGNSATGSFTAVVFPATVPTPAPPASALPMPIPALADLYLIDQPNGTGFLGAISQGVTTGGYVTAVTPYSAPPQVPISLTPGETLHFSTIGGASLSLGGVGASTTAAANGLSAISGVNGLIGVFVGNTIDPTKTPANSAPPNPASKTQTPALQQVFYAGGGSGTLTVNGATETFDFHATVVVPAGATRLFVAPVGGGLTFNSTVYPYSLMVTPDNPNAPQINAGGIVTNAGFLPGPVAPSSMVAIFGANFGPESYPSGLPLPTTLGATQVYFGTVPAPLFYVSPTQIVAQVPYETPISGLAPANGANSSGAASALVTVVSNGVPSIGQPALLSSMDLQMFTASGVPVITDSNTGQLVSATSPASRGDTLIIWTTGLGYTAFDPATGNGAPDTTSVALLPVAATLKNSASGTTLSLVPQYAGLAPGFVALDQINIQIPTTAQTGTAILQLVTPGFGTPASYVIGIQ